MQHNFNGKWITTEEFAAIKPRNVFHRQLQPIELPCDEHRNRHILFRKKFTLDKLPESAKIFISADDYYKLYINGNFITQGPAPSYHFSYNYNEADITPFLKNGENVIAVHTLYQGLINRVWQSGDNRHGLIMDILTDGETTVKTDQSFKTAYHTAYSETGIFGYDTQFAESYDSTAPEVGFEKPNFDDGNWRNAVINLGDDHKLTEQKSSMLVFENIEQKSIKASGSSVIYDFGSNYVGYLDITAVGKQGNTVTIRCAQELDEAGKPRYKLRANCVYEENWYLDDGESKLDQFDYKAFRYAELILPDGVEITDIKLIARHYPFKLFTDIKPQYRGNSVYESIWKLCVNSQKYGVQEVIQDCMEREKGFYVGDGCYTALTNMLMTGDDSMVRKLIDDGFASDFIDDTLVTCLNCSFMQEIAEFPLILVYLVLWHYNLTHDTKYLNTNYPKAVKLLEAYRKRYETDKLIRNLDKWCVVEWPANFQHDYDVDILQGKVCEQAHISINAYYIEAIKVANRIASILEIPQYRDIAPLINAFGSAFYNKEKALFKDGEATEHISIVGNSFAYAFGLCDDERFKAEFKKMFLQYGMHSLSLFCTFPLLMRFAIDGDDELLEASLCDEGTWLRMLREDATTTFEGWGKETKNNASLFHLTMSYAAVFIADVDIKKLFEGM